MSVKLLTEHHLKFRSLTGGCTGSSESTLVKIQHDWKSHVAAHMRSRYNVVPVRRGIKPGKVPLYKYSKCSCGPYRANIESVPKIMSYYLYLAHCFKILAGSFVIAGDQDKMQHGWSFYQGLHCLVTCIMKVAPGLRLFFHKTSIK